MIENDVETRFAKRHALATPSKPSKITRSPLVLRSRKPMTFWYSSDLYQVSAASREETLYHHALVRILAFEHFKVPPRAKKTRPCDESVATTCLRCSLNKASSCTDSASIRDAFIRCLYICLEEH
jgi:hypothetical protein